MKLAVKSRYFEILIAVAFVVLLLYLLSAALRVTRGVSRTIEPPEYRIRLQILNGCGVNGLAGKVADKMDNFTDAYLGVVVVDTDNFESLEIDSSFVVSRQEDQRAAELLAERLGIDKDGVIYEPLEANHRHVSVTLVLGKDHERLQYLIP